MDGILGCHDPAVFGEHREKANEALGYAAVKRTDGRHIKNFPVQQFHSRIGAKHSSPGHPVILFNAETMLALNRHKEKVSNPIRNCKPALAPVAVRTSLKVSAQSV